MTLIEPLALEPILHVARNMRAEDRREIEATRWHFDPERLALETLASARFGCCAAHDLEPVAVVAAIEYWPGFYSVGMFATDKWPKVALSLTRWVRQRMSAQLLAAGAHRMECRVIEGHGTAMRWLESLGAVREAALVDCGRNRETFYLYAWRLSDVPSRTVQLTETTASAAAAVSAGAERG